MNHSGPLTRIEKRLRLAGAIVAAGLLVELATMPFVHPLAFMAFAVVGCGLIFVGMVIYLISLVTAV